MAGRKQTTGSWDGFRRADGGRHKKAGDFGTKVIVALYSGILGAFLVGGIFYFLGGVAARSSWDSDLEFHRKESAFYWVMAGGFLLGVILVPAIWRYLNRSHHKR